MLPLAACAVRSPLPALGVGCRAAARSPSSLCRAPSAAQARDAFYQCVRECGLLYTSGSEVPAKCKQLRAQFEGACLPSWVRPAAPSARGCRVSGLAVAGRGLRGTPARRAQRRPLARSLRCCAPAPLSTPCPRMPCPPQPQVKHFDEQQDLEARNAKRLHAAIQQKAATAAGNLSGAAQR